MDVNTDVLSYRSHRHTVAVHIPGMPENRSPAILGRPGKHLFSGRRHSQIHELSFADPHLIQSNSCSDIVFLVSNEGTNTSYILSLSTSPFPMVFQASPLFLPREGIK